MRIIDADMFTNIDYEIPEGVDNDSYINGVNFVLELISSSSTVMGDRDEATWIVPTVVGGRQLNVPHCGNCGSMTNARGKFCSECGAIMKNVNRRI